MGGPDFNKGKIALLNTYIGLLITSQTCMTNVFFYGRHQEPVKSWLFGLDFHLECGYKV